MKELSFCWRKESRMLREKKRNVRKNGRKKVFRLRGVMGLQMLWLSFALKMRRPLLRTQC